MLNNTLWWKIWPNLEPSISKTKWDRDTDTICKLPFSQLLQGRF